MLYIIYQNGDFQPQIEYTFKVIFSIYGVEWKLVEYDKLGKHQVKPQDFIISYGEKKPSSYHFKNHIHIYESELFGKDYLKTESLPRTPLSRFGNLPIIYPGKGDIPEHVIINITAEERTIETDIDIIAASFFMLSRYEEVVLSARDQHDRFPAKASLAYKEGFLDRPVVNEYIELLWGWIESLKPESTRGVLWPDDKDFAVCLTHDVESIRKYSLLPLSRSVGGALLRQKKPRLALNLAWDYLGSVVHLRKDPHDTFDYILNLEQKYGFKSSFYFMAGGGSAFDVNYSINKPKVIKLIQRIENVGCEIGVHGSYNSYNNSEKMASEKEMLDRITNNKSYGCRQHYLRWKTPDTWRIQQEAKLLYDTTLCFAEHAGFRCGICLPFKPFDVLENRELDIWELPLTVMEGSLQDPNYQNLSPEQGFGEIIKLMEVVSKFKGIFVVLWHNSSFDPLAGWADWKIIYEKMMRHIGEQNAWVAPGREIVEWWKGSYKTRG